VGEVVQDNEAVCIPHAASFPVFFSSTGQCAPCMLPCFRWFFPPRPFPPPARLTRRCDSHTPSRFLSFLSTGRCAPCTPPCFHSFIPPGGPPPGKSTRQRVHPTPCLVIFLFFVDGAEPAPIPVHFHPLLGGILFFPRWYCQRGGL